MKLSADKSLSSVFDCTIIVLTKDNPQELKQTLSSLSCQIIDFSAEILVIHSWSDSILFSRVIDYFSPLLSQFSLSIHELVPAPGIYPSMNYALSVSSGDSLVFLNSGDTYVSANSLSRLYHYWRSLSSRSSSIQKAVFSQAFVHAYSGYLVWKTPPCQNINIQKWLDFAWPCHQSLLFDGNWARNNPYKVDKGVSADKYVIISALKSNTQDSFYSYPLVNYYLTGVSSKPPSLATLLRNLRTNSVSANLVLVSKFLLSPVWFFYPTLVFLKSWLVALCSFKPFYAP